MLRLCQCSYGTCKLGMCNSREPKVRLTLTLDIMGDRGDLRLSHVVAMGCSSGLAPSFLSLVYYSLCFA